MSAIPSRPHDGPLPVVGEGLVDHFSLLRCQRTWEPETRKPPRAGCRRRSWVILVSENQPPPPARARYRLDQDKLDEVWLTSEETVMVISKVMPEDYAGSEEVSRGSGKFFDDARRIGISSRSRPSLPARSSRLSRRGDSGGCSPGHPPQPCPRSPGTSGCAAR